MGFLGNTTTDTGYLFENHKLHTQTFVSLFPFDGLLTCFSEHLQNPTYCYPSNPPQTTPRRTFPGENKSLT